MRSATKPAPMQNKVMTKVIAVARSTMGQPVEISREQLIQFAHPATAPPTQPLQFRVAAAFRIGHPTINP